MKIKGITNIKYFSKGKRGLIHIGYYKGIKVGIKVKNPESKAFERIQNEIKFLKILNKHNIGPKLLMEGRRYFVYEFQEGIYFDDWMKDKTDKQIIKVLIKLLQQCFIMDELGINKEEMLRPYENVIIKKYNKPVLIDFERCHYSKKVKNVTQLVQFMINKTFIDKNIIKLLQKYKEEVNNSNFNMIINYIAN